MCKRDIPNACNQATNEMEKLIVNFQHSGGQTTEGLLQASDEITSLDSDLEQISLRPICKRLRLK